MQHIFGKNGLHLLIVSFMVFIFLNILENYIHYNIGRNHDMQYIKLSAPTSAEWIKIIVVMLTFAVLQSFFTYIFD
jgi:hypothetical protein